MKLTFKGNPLTLKGNAVKVGDSAPDFETTANDLSSFSLADTRGIRIFTTFPSIDTQVCDLQVKRFNQAVEDFKNVTLYAISADLPFAQARWCAAANTSRVITLSDHRLMSFAENWGVYVKELRLLARSVFIVDSRNAVTYIEIVSEMTEQPDYEKAFSALKKL